MQFDNVIEKNKKVQFLPHSVLIITALMIYELYTKCRILSSATIYDNLRS